MEVTRRIQVRNRPSSCRPGLGLALLGRKTEETGSAAVGTVSGLTPRDQGRKYSVGGGVGGWWAVAQWAARAGPPATIRRLAGGPLRRWNSPRATAKWTAPRGDCGMKLRNPTISSPTGNYCASAGREREGERQKSQNRPTVV